MAVAGAAREDAVRGGKVVVGSGSGSGGVAGGDGIAHACGGRSACTGIAGEVLLLPGMWHAEDGVEALTADEASVSDCMVVRYTSFAAQRIASAVLRKSSGIPSGGDHDSSICHRRLASAHRSGSAKIVISLTVASTDRIEKRATTEIIVLVAVRKAVRLPRIADHSSV